MNKEIVMPCGCAVVWVTSDHPTYHYKRQKIEYCDLHGAATDMVAALKNWFVCADEHDVLCRCGRDRATAAITKTQANNIKKMEGLKKAAENRKRFKKGDIVTHVNGGKGEVRNIESKWGSNEVPNIIAVVRVLDTSFHDIRRIPVKELSLAIKETPVGAR